MRIISPVDHAREAVSLLQAGADELYGGYVPHAWQQRFGLLASINQRTFDGAQIDSYGGLCTVAQACKDSGGQFALTLNTSFYTDAQLPLLLDYVGEALEAGVTSVILADLGLLRTLKAEFPRLLFHASTLAHLTNSAAIRFYQAQGIGRVILPRHLSLAEMVEIRRQVPDIPCDAFLLVGKCPNTEGLCSFHHSSADKIWPCEIPYQIEPVAEPVSLPLKQAMKAQASWATTNRRHGCGLCAIPQLMHAGFDGLKLVGRGAPTQRKLMNISTAVEYSKLALEIKDFSTYREAAISSHKRIFGVSCSENVCYYPELFEHC
ncbi:peptidase U32 family protein [Geopsychrobacter electrodiphilus]|uniref:peptidase U32 family protein n=1 Tax=Geopsychrobacter electrodiphilus TaxID=225196 RepID=UPI00036E28A4|nr:U32 family peptidase [Geopsychrobacter electrodiphilus]